MIQEDYVSFETAKLLKEKGFDWECNSAPTLQTAMKWLREVHNINIDIVSVWNQKRFEYQVFIVTPENAKHCYVDKKLYFSYEKACETNIKYCLENFNLNRVISVANPTAES